MPLNDLYEGSLHMELAGEELFNVFHFQALSELTDAFDLATRIINQWITANWETLVGLAVSFVEIAVRNLYDANDVATIPIGTTGAGINEVLPPHDAMQIRLNTPVATITGSKRVPGLMENNQNNGTWVAAALSAWSDFAFDNWSSPIIGAGGALVYQTVVVKRIKYTTPGGSTAYRLPTNSGEAVFAQVITGTVEPSVRTQRSRDFKE